MSQIVDIIVEPNIIEVEVTTLGERGLKGDQGFEGWTPQTEIEIVSGRALRKLVGYFGGTGTEPTLNVGKYEGIGGWVTNPADALPLGTSAEVADLNDKLIQISKVGKNRKSKYLAYDATLKRLIVVGSDTTNINSDSDAQIFNITINGVTIPFNGFVGVIRDFSAVTLVGNMAIVFNKLLTAVTLADLRLVNDASISPDDIKIAHISYGTGLTSRWIIDYNIWTERTTAYSNSVSLINDLSDLKFTTRMNKYITYDFTTKTLTVVGSNAIAPSDLQIMTVRKNGKTFIIRGAIGTTKVLSTYDPSLGSAQIGFPENIADPTNVLLSDFIVLNNQTGNASNFVKLAQIVYNDALNSQVLKDARYFIFNAATSINSSLNTTSNNFVFNTKILNRKRKWLSYDRANQKLIVVGSDASAPSDEQIVTLISDGISYVLKGFVGASKTFTGISGNAQFFIPKSVTPSNVTLADIVVFVDSTNRDATHIKIAHITYNDGFTSNFIIDYQDYIDRQNAISVSKTSKSLSFLNNSIGETNFANGVQTKLKVLALGNSFMRNSVAYLSQIASGASVNLTVGNLYTGGTNLLNHLGALANNTNPYQYHKYENGVQTVNELSGQTSMRGLTDERWDAIILHQYTPWTQPFEPYLSDLIKLIVARLGYCPKFYLNATWAGHQDYVLAQYGFATETLMWQYMLDTTTQACIDSGINTLSLIPTGTAIQNARTLAYADTYVRFVNGSPDWHHLNSAGGFIAACTVYEKIIYPLNKIHCSATTFRLNAATDMPPETGITNPGVVVTDANYLSMCNSAIDAVKFPTVITPQ